MNSRTQRAKSELRICQLLRSAGRLICLDQSVSSWRYMIRRDAGLPSLTENQQRMKICKQHRTNPKIRVTTPHLVGTKGKERFPRRAIQQIGMLSCTEFGGLLRSASSTELVQITGSWIKDHGSKFLDTRYLQYSLA